MTDTNSFGGWLKNALIKPTDENTPVAQQTDQVQSVMSPNPSFMRAKPTPTRTTPTPSPVINDGELDDQYINHLSDFMTKNNLPGPDYLEFARSLDEMISEMDGASEEKIFKMTYKVGYKQTLTVPKLIETASSYITLFNQHKKEFDDYLDSENQKTVGNKVTENENLSKTNSNILKQIEELKKQIINLETNYSNNNAKVEENNTIIDTETAKFESKKLKFQNAFNFVVGKVNDDIQKIKLYLNNIQ